MNRRRPTTRWALWVFAAALLLKAAMPWLASASAHAQGKTLVEVCTVYGVATVPLDGGGQGAAADTSSDHRPDHRSEHGGEHCALTALSALAASELPSFGIGSPPHSAVSSALAHPSPQAPDACATWVARLKHGPPALA